MKTYCLLNHGISTYLKPKCRRRGTHPLGSRDNVSQCHGDRQLSLVSHHGDQLHQPLKAVSQHRLSQRVKLSSLLQDFGQHFHEGGSSLQVFVVAQTCGGGVFNFSNISRMLQAKVTGIDLPMECMRPLSTLALRRLDMARTVQ